MSGRVHFAKYISDPITLLYVVGSKGLSLVILFSVQGVCVSSFILSNFIIT